MQAIYIALSVCSREKQESIFFPTVLTDKRKPDTGEVGLKSGIALCLCKLQPQNFSQSCMNYSRSLYNVYLFLLQGYINILGPVLFIFILHFYCVYTEPITRLESTILCSTSVSWLLNGIRHNAA